MSTAHNFNDFPKQPANFEDLISYLSFLRDDLLSMLTESEGLLDMYPPKQLASALNLLNYLALRSRDLRPLQMQLVQMGLSSLGRAESNVLATLDAVLSLLHQVVQRPWQPSPLEHPFLDFEAAQQLLEEHTEALLGPEPADRGVRIMVTMPSEAADNYTLVDDLLKSGMNCMRINCAHDDVLAWSKMIENLRTATKATDHSCRIIMDLAGPKLRTGALQPGPAVLKIRPKRNQLGETTLPARIWLTSQETLAQPSSTAYVSLPVASGWLAKLSKGDHIKFRDARGATRTLKVVNVTEEGCWAEAKKSAYIIPGTILNVQSRKGKALETTVGVLPAREIAIRLKPKDLLILERELEYGRPAKLDGQGLVLSPAIIGFPFPEVFEDVRAGEPIWFDDGKIGGIIERTEADRLYVRITHSQADGLNLGSGKGINLPESNLRLSAMTTKDVEDLKFIASHADMVALSFANSVQDVQLLQEHLTKLDKRQLGIVLKIETRRGFEKLPSMLLEIMKVPCCGVMIARGDLAVECGFERMAEVQTEILWICEAAHVPVIWATQVLESLAKEGMPSRAEISDAAMGQGAECVMLNKGTHIIEAVQMLDDILKRMQGHQNKKRSMMRELHLASTFRDRDPLL
ncbi:MAG: pyruvate kinase [Desulfosporosinus sp.]|nr:pyruvate kinase [Desulfosporosinus sp.]